MTLTVAARRQGYRFAFALLRAYWFATRPTLHGVKCVLTTGDQVLLVRHTYGAPHWDLPGGAVRRRERPEATARREMHEELGVVIDRWALLGEVRANSYHCRDTLHCYTAEVDRPKFVFDRAELAAAGWFPLAQLPPDIKPHVPPILALLWTEAPKRREPGASMRTGSHAPRRDGRQSPMP